MSAGRLVLVSGMSGAGRTTVMKTLEDLGFFCVDNLPVVLLEELVGLFRDRDEDLAVVVDVREREFLDAFPEAYDRLGQLGVEPELLFLDAADDVLAQRFDEVRRAHPLVAGRNVRERIGSERALLGQIARRADVVIDTTHLSVHDLKRYVTRHFTGTSQSRTMEIELVSFGYRFGAPEVADLVIDVRFLPNPHFEPTLRERTGLDPQVAAYVLDRPATAAFLQRFYDFLDFLMPLYQDEGKAFLTIAMGCTGGRHRSVAVVEALDRHLRERKIDARVTHRDADRNEGDRA